MAKRKSRNGVNKSAAIRDYLKDHRGAKPMEIVAALKEQGIEVSTAFVSTVKSSIKRSKRQGKKTKPAAAGRNGHSAVSVTELLMAKQLADKIGSVEKAKEALDTLVQLQ